MDEGKIQAVEPGIQEKKAEVIDVTGKLLFPGFIDAHTHFDLHVAGTVTADNFETGTKAALSGGTTMIIDFATQYQGETLKKALENWHKNQMETHPVIMVFILQSPIGILLSARNWKKSLRAE
uniref:amidohydrolase family protein n=1 Tax=Clostridium sp. NkU-1 TaxID=1095009 RepID=UPI000A74CDA1